MEKLSQGQDLATVPLQLHYERALTLRGHEEVHTLQHIQKEFIPAILDALPPPTNLPSHLAGDLGLLFFCLHGNRDEQQWPHSLPLLIILSLSQLHPLPSSLLVPALEPIFSHKLNGVGPGEKGAKLQR